MSRDDHLHWFHGKLSRESAEELIKQGNEDGTFLVRESSTAAGDFVLTLLFKDEVCHYQIRRHGEDAFFSIDDKVKILHGLDTLVDFYQQASNGLVTQLTVPLKKDPPPHNTRSHGSTNLLHRATKQNDSTVVSEMLKCGYRNFDAKNHDGQTALHLAALYCDEPILKLLLDAGVNANSMDSFGYQPLHYACRSKPASFIHVLIEANANVQGINIKNGYVPLHEAAKYGNLAAVKELLAAHAPHLPRTKSGEFPFDLAKEAGQVEVELFLENYKIPPATTTRDQWYHGTLNREEAKATLNKYANDMESTQDVEGKPVDTSGCFLVRYSQNRERSDYVLTLLWNKQVKNFIISQASLLQNGAQDQQSSLCKYLYIDDGPFWPSLEHLVENFMRFSYGLPVSLKYPVPPKPKPEVPSFSTIPRPQRKNVLPSVTSHSTQFSNTSLLSPNSGQAALIADKHSQTLTTPMKKKPKEHSMFNTLKLRSPKFDMNSLRKKKNKQKRSDSEGSCMAISSEEEIQKAQTLFKSISFSTDIVSVNTSLETPPDSEFYNVPKNNAAVPNANANAVNAVNDDLSPIEPLEPKTEAEVEYFTKSDVAIERERLLVATNQAPIPYPLNSNGYLPTEDLRFFVDADASTKESSAAELREFAKHPERLDSLISTISTESEMARYLNRQFSTASQFSSPTTPTAEAAKLNYFIPADCLELDSIVGEGEFGSVYKGCLLRRNSRDGQEQRYEVAIKTLRDEHCRSNKQEFLREASVMIRLQHHCIVQLIGISKGKTLMMVQELVPLGSMLHFILDNRSIINTNHELKLWASQIACGMHYLESQHFVHRDLAARNILLASRNQAKISDFGLSRTLGSDSDCYQATQGGKWPIKWYAPESFNNGIFSHASDVWSFGVTLWEMFSLGEPPYGDIRGVEAIQMIESGQRLPQPSLCPNHVYEIMINCWNYKPKERPTFRYLMDFFVKDPDYQNLLELVKTVDIS